MLQNLSEEARECLRCAHDCAERARFETDPSLRRDFIAMEQRWLKLANSYQFLEQLGLFTANNKQRRAELSRRLEEINLLLKKDRSQQEAIGLPALTAPTKVKSQLQSHTANLAVGDPWSIRLVEVCATAGVELLRYPVSAERQSAGQTMAIAALSRCLKRYGTDTLITALQCITQTNNNKPGALTARIIKALCALLAADPVLRDGGLALLDRFDRIDLIALSNKSAAEAAAEKIDVVSALVILLRRELNARAAQPLASDADHHIPLAPDAPG